MSAQAPVVVFAFDGRNEAAQRAAKRQAAAMVSSVATETKRAIRALIVRSIRDGLAPVEAARMIRSAVGLTAAQAQSAANYRGELVAQGHIPARVASLVERYVKQKIRERALTIARTEVMGALNSGSRESWRQAQGNGLLGPDAAREWITTGDERLCPICEPMDGQKATLAVDFPVGGPPAHPRCRCTAGIVP